MATLATEMPPLHTAEALAGVTAPVSSQNTSGGGPGASGGANNPGIDSTQSPEADTANNTASSNNNSQSNSNNTISAAADSSDNQPGTPQPHLSNVNESAQNSSAAHHPYANHHIYANSQPSTTTAANTHLNQMYAQHIYSQPNLDLQQQQQQQQQHSSYPSYLNSYEQFYQQQQQQQQQQQNPTQSSSQTQNSQQMDFINSNSNSMYSASEYKQLAGVRYHPYLHTPTSGIPSVNSQNSNSNNALDANSQTAPVVSSASSSLMSPRVVSSTSPSSSSNQMQISGRASSIGSMSAGNPSSPNSAGSLQCKKCGIMCTNESELQEHITNVHGASPYGSSGYASSPYIKEEMQQQTPPSQSHQQQQQQSNAQQPPVQGGNPGEILDLDSQKMLYPPTPGSMVAMMHPSLGNSDPLHGLHSMQQRAGMNTWDQQAQAQEGLPPFLQQQQQQQTTESKILPNHSPFYQSPKQSPYHVSNSSNVIKTEYQPQPLIKTEYTGDTQQYIDDKSFDPTAPNQQQQQMMPPAVSSSPAEFPSTTTGGPQDNGQQNVVANQQFRAGNFEPPSSSSATLSTGPVGSKAANWKSNEARRPKTYNCTACNKWFTSSGHLKRHYNTTLHKNAVKSSGQPDPATLPISVHHHPARDPSGKAGRRGAAAAAAAAAAANAGNISAQQQQQPPNPVQPPEPPNSPQDYGGAPVAAGGLTPLSHYAATPSPNSMYQQQQYQQHQYMPQVQSTTNASPQHASTMVNHHLQQQQHQHQNQQQTQQAVMNGHPNALAGLSVPPTRQQTPMPSSQMRGLLNTTMPSSTATTITTTMHIIKNEHLEAATMDEHMDHDEEVEELGYLTTAEVKQEYLEETEEEGHNVYSPKDDMESVQGEELSKEELEQESELVLQHQRLQEVEEQAAGVLREVDHNVVHHHNSSQLPTLRQLQHFRLEQQQHPADMERLYHNTTPSSTHSNMPLHSPLIISHQQYQEQLQQQHQMLTQGTYTLTQTPPLPPQQLQHNTMEHQPYINMPLAINTQQPPSNMLQLQPPLTTEQQLPPDTTIPITNMANMLPPNHHHMQQPQQQHTELQPLANTQLQPDTINTNIPSHITTTSNITNIPSYHHLQQPGSVLPPLDHTLTYPHTIIGNAEVLTLDAYGNLVSTSGQHHQVIQTADGQLVQLISTGSTAATSLYSSQSYCPYIAQRSPQEGDLPPMTQHCQQEPTTTTTLTVMPSSMSYSPSQGNSNSSEYEYKPSKNEDYLNNNNFNEEPQQLQMEAKTINNETTAVSTSGTSFNKRKRNPSTSSSMGANSTMLPSGRIKCLPCDKEFTKICYLTQHNKSFHSGEYPFRCQKCGKRYQSEDVYITHLGKHKTIDKAHKCEICPKQFHHKTDLRRHVEAIHTGNKQHVCDVCEKSFCRKDHLRKHMETHNRPRVVAKKINSRGNNNTTTTNSSGSCSSSVRITKAFATVEGHNNNNTKTTTSEKPLNSSSPAISIGNSSLPAVSAVHLNETNSLSSATTSTPSPLMQQIDDVAADDDELLEDDLDEYDDGHDIEENEDFNMPQYEQHVVQSSAQYNLGSKSQVYQIVEQELPMY